MNWEIIDLVADICGAKVEKFGAPLIGKYCVVTRPDGTKRRITGGDPEIPAPLEVAYENIPDGEIIRIYIGSAYHGPMLMWSRGRWHNCYSHGNCGKNVACGGTWTTDGRRAADGYATVAEALDARRNRLAADPKGEVIPLPARCRYTENETIYRAILALIEKEGRGDE